MAEGSGGRDSISAQDVTAEITSAGTYAGIDPMSGLAFMNPVNYGPTEPIGQLTISQAWTTGIGLSTAAYGAVTDNPVMALSGLAGAAPGLLNAAAVAVGLSQQTTMPGTAVDVGYMVGGMDRGAGASYGGATSVSDIGDPQTGHGSMFA